MYMAWEPIEKGGLMQVGDSAFATGHSDFLVQARHKSLSNAAETFRTCLTEHGRTPTACLPAHRENGGDAALSLE